MSTGARPPSVVAVARDDAHRFSKPLRDEIRLIEGGVVRAGDPNAVVLPAEPHEPLSVV